MIYRTFYYKYYQRLNLYVIYPQVHFLTFSGMMHRYFKSGIQSYIKLKFKTRNDLSSKELL